MDTVLYKTARTLLRIILSNLVITCTLSNCTDNPCAYINNKNSNFIVSPSASTPDGIRVEDPYSLTPEELHFIIDKQANEVEECLTETFGADLHIDTLTASKAGCYENAGIGLQDFRDIISVKIVSNFTLSHDGTQELLPLAAGKEVCLAKGLAPTKDFPCNYRVSVQNCDEIIIPPSAYLFKDALVRVITGCAYIWRNELLSNCAKPTVPALSGIKKRRITNDTISRISKEI